MTTKTDSFLAMLDSKEIVTRRQRNTAKPVADSGIPTFLKRDNNNKLPQNKEVAVKQSESRPDFADDIDAMVARLVADGDVRFDVTSDQYVAPYYRQRKLAVMTGKVTKGAW